MATENQNRWKSGSYYYPLEAMLMREAEKWSEDRDASLPKDPRVSTILDDWKSIFAPEEPFSRNDVLAMVEGAADAAMHMMDRPDTFCEEGQENLGCVLTGLGSPGACELFEESLQVRLARRGIVTAEAAGRLCRLVQQLWLVSGLSVATPIMDYLRLVARTYVCGFDAACISNCGSALEQALKSGVPDDLCERLLGPEDWYTFGERLEIARGERFFHKGPAPSDKRRNESLADATKYVWDLRNKVVHYEPALTEKVDDIVRDTFWAVAALTTGRDPLRCPWY